MKEIVLMQTLLMGLSYAISALNGTRMSWDSIKAILNLFLPTCGMNTNLKQSLSVVIRLSGIS